MSAQWLYTIRDQRIPHGAFGTVFDDARTRWVDQRAMGEVRLESPSSRRYQVMGRVYTNFYQFDGDYLYGGDAPGDDTLTTERYRGIWFGAEARAVLRPLDTLRVTVGAEATIHPVVEIDGQEFDLLGEPVDAPYVAASRPYQVIAGYALAEWAPVEKVRLTAGARLDYWSTFGVAVNPRLAAIVRPTANDTVKIMGGRAFRAPTAYELDYTDGGITQLASTTDGYTLEPETVWSAELEYARRIGADWVVLGSGHLQHAERLVETQTVGAPEDAIIAYRNSNATLLALGGDIEVRRELRGGYMLAAQYGYLYTRYDRTPDGAPDRRSPFAPRHFGSARAIVPIDVIGARLAMRVTLEAPRRISPTEQAATKTAAIADVVFSGRIRDRHVRYSFGAYNLFDYRYALPVGDTFATPALPQFGRTFMAQIDVEVP